MHKAYLERLKFRDIFYRILLSSIFSFYKKKNSGIYYDDTTPHIDLIINFKMYFFSIHLGANYKLIHPSEAIMLGGCSCHLILHENCKVTSGGRGRCSHTPLIYSNIKLLAILNYTQ